MYILEIGHVGMEDSLCGHVGIQEGSGNPVVVLRVSPVFRLIIINQSTHN